jgi:hypothetical protein
LSEFKRLSCEECLTESEEVVGLWLKKECVGRR